jgi:hypothetical protein
MPLTSLIDPALEHFKDFEEFIFLVPGIACKFAVENVAVRAADRNLPVPFFKFIAEEH